MTGEHWQNWQIYAVMRRGSVNPYGSDSAVLGTGCLPNPRTELAQTLARIADQWGSEQWLSAQFMEFGPQQMAARLHAITAAAGQMMEDGKRAAALRLLRWLHDIFPNRLEPKELLDSIAEQAKTRANAERAAPARP